MGFNCQDSGSFIELQPMQLKMSDNSKEEKCEEDLAISDETVEWLLLKALEAKNKQLLKCVIRNRNSQIITNALKTVPPGLVPILIESLVDQPKKRIRNITSVFVWFKCLLQTHNSIVMENIHLFQELSTVIDHKMALRPRLSELQGRLDLLIYQAEDSSHTDQQSSMIVSEVKLDNSDQEGDEIEYEVSSDNDSVPVWNGECSDDEMEVDADNASGDKGDDSKSEDTSDDNDSGDET